MPFLRLPLQHYTFRLTLMYLALFGASFLLLFGILVWNTDRDARAQLRAELVSDALYFVERDQLAGELGVIRLIGSRINNADLTNPAMYIYRNPQQEILAGTLGNWPLTSHIPRSQPGLRTATVIHNGQQFLTLHQRLPGGGEILLGRSTAAIDAARRKLVKVFAVGSLLTLALGLLGGFLLSRRAVARIEAINRLCEQIIDGNLSQRLALHSDRRADDLDQLSGNINRMLDRIETLMTEVSTVSNHIAHDLRTPLSKLRNQLETLATTSRAPDNEKTQIQQAIGDADQLLSTFNALLRIARIESGQRQAAFEPLSLKPIAEDALEMYAPLAEDAALKLRLVAPATFDINGDRNLLFQALANLLDNAIKHSHAAPGSTITLSLSGKDSQVEIQVCDQGEGIPEHELAQASKRFYRLDASRSTPGNGLGLSLVKAIANLHHGGLVLATNPPQGLCATLHLPRKSNNPTASSGVYTA